MFEHAVGSIKHIPMALYRFQNAAGCIYITLIVRNLRTKRSGLLHWALARAYWQLVLFGVRFALLMSRANSTAQHWVPSPVQEAFSDASIAQAPTSADHLEDVHSTCRLRPLSHTLFTHGS